MIGVKEKKPMTPAQFWKERLVGKKVTPKYQMYLDYLEEFKKENNTNQSKCQSS